MMHHPAFVHSSYCIAKMTFTEIEAFVKGKPAIILPLGATEPCSQYGALGTGALSCNALANALSEKRSILLAPMVTYGYSTAFQAFTGCAAISGKKLAAILYNLMRSWAGQGIRTFIIIDGTFDDADAVSEASKRLSQSHKDAQCLVLNWSAMAEIRSFIAQKHEGIELGYSQVGLLSMAAFIDETYVRPPLKKISQPITAGPAEFKRWRKMGGDPEKFRKMFPDARLSEAASAYSPELGKELFMRINAAFETEIARELDL